jgi:hypothetical protein
VSLEPWDKSHVRISCLFNLQPFHNACVAEQEAKLPLPCKEAILTVTTCHALLLALVFPALSTIILCSDCIFTRLCNNGYLVLEICRSKRSHFYCISAAYFAHSAATGAEAQYEQQRLEVRAVQRNTSF